MAQSPNIPTPREPLHGPDGLPNRTWWRFWNNLGVNSGGLTEPVTIAPNSIITPGQINSGSTVTLADSPPSTVLGNSQGVAAPPVPQVVDPSLSFNNGTLAVQSIPARTLSGNPAFVTAPPGVIQIGPNLSLTGNVLDAAPTGGSFANLAMVKTIVYWGM